MVDPSGALDLYAASMAVTFDHPKQVMDLYMAPGGGAVSPQLFEDLQVESRVHRRLLEDGIVRCCCHGNADSRDAAGDAETSEAHGPPASGKPARSLEDWLLSLDGGKGGLLCYLPRLAAHYDDLSQLVDLYVFNGSRGLTFDRQFLVDAGISANAHADLVETWFAQVCGAQRVVNPQIRPAWRVVAPEGPTPLRSRAGACLTSFQAWLQDVGRGVQLTEYTKRLEDLYDSPAQVLSLYWRPGAGMDPMFLEDAGVTTASDQELFRCWFSAWQP